MYNGMSQSRKLLTLPSRTPGLGEAKAFARDVERATQQLKELRQEVHILIILRILGGSIFGGQNSTVAEVSQDMVKKGHRLLMCAIQQVLTPTISICH